MSDRIAISMCVILSAMIGVGTFVAAVPWHPDSVWDIDMLKVSVLAGLVWWFASYILAADIQHEQQQQQQSKENQQ